MWKDRETEDGNFTIGETEAFLRRKFKRYAFKDTRREEELKRFDRSTLHYLYFSQKKARKKRESLL